MPLTKLTSLAALTLASLLICSTPASADVQFAAPGVAGSVTNLAVGGELYDVTFVGTITHTAWVSQLDFNGETEAEAAIQALAAVLNAEGGVTGLRFSTPGGGTFDHTSGTLWHDSNATMILGESLIKSGANWFLGNPLPGGAQAPLNGSFPLALDFTLVEASPWTDVGMGLAGTGALTPVLAGSGDLLTGSTTTLSLSDALPSSSVYLVAGFSELSVPFKGGVMVPAVDLLHGPFPVMPAGEFEVSVTWPAGVPSGFESWYQAWVQDAGGPVGFAASNGLMAVSP
ncbi:MAG: hypothetical protein DHS20C15_10630 [Planctomycetota bacterium]|nr:MAG: hypothetical protein DHS20C15_10630 [Planctomycetota bacterium]